MDSFTKAFSPLVVDPNLENLLYSESSTPLGKASETQYARTCNSILSPANHVSRLPKSSPIYRILHSDYKISPISPCILSQPVHPPPGFSMKPPEVSRLSWDDDSFAKTTRRLDYIEEMAEDSEKVIDDLKREVERYKRTDLITNLTTGDATQSHAVGKSEESLRYRHMSPDSAKELNKYKSIYRHLMAKKDELAEARSEGSVTDLFKILSLDDSCTEDCEACRTYKAENEQLQTTVAKLSGENVKLLGNFNSLYNYFSKVMRDKKQLARKVTGLTTDIDEFRGSFTDLTSQHCNLAELSLKVDHTEQQLACVEAERKASTIAKQNLEVKLRDTLATLARTETDNHALKQELRNATQSIDALKLSSAEQAEVVRELNEYITRRSLEFTQRQISSEETHKASLLELENQIQTLNEQNLTLKASLRNCKAYITANCPLIEDRTIEKCMDCSVKATELDQLKSKLTELQAYISSTSAKSASLNETHNLYASCSKQLAILSKAAGNLEVSLETIRKLASFTVNSDSAMKRLYVTLEGVKQLPETVNLKPEEVEVIRNLARAAQEVLDLQSPGSGATKDLRSSVHKKIVSIEMMFNELSANYDANRLRQTQEAYLELPYLLKPLFDALRDCERGPSHLIKAACSALQSVSVMQYEQLKLGSMLRANRSN